MTEAFLTVRQPKVTVAIPTLNRVGYLHLALESALSQTYNNLEIVVSNNASSDDTASYLASCTDPRLIVLHQPHTIPMTDNWNACLAAATGEYFLLLSDDDILEPHAIQELVFAYRAQVDLPKPGIVYCGGRIIDAAGKTIRLLRDSPARETARELILAFFEGKRDLRFCGVLLRTADLAAGFPSNYTVACDAAVWIHAAMKHGTALFVAKQLISYRVHPNLSSATQLDVWGAEYKQLLALVLREDAKQNSGDPAFATLMISTMQRLDRAMIIVRINQAFAQDKIRALFEYGKHISAFRAFPKGHLSLASGLLALFVDERKRNWFRRILGRRPATLAQE